ncbi:MAG TPA: hypothetical protein VGQ06_06070 [Gemmatimonadales bacterium]|jgi:hypothetical protein|nr:hypothetical protein [Gemmatimonadales bacterium]
MAAAQRSPNPTATCLRQPSGRNAVTATLLLPVEGAAPTESGFLLYHMLADEPRPQPENVKELR